jgi:Mg-chelatase subunit ChlD
LDEVTQSKVAMVSLFPEMNEEEVFSEIIFVVDRSGSMAGSKMSQGREMRFSFDHVMICLN